MSNTSVLKRFSCALALLAFCGIASAQTAFQTCAFSDPTHCYGIGPGSPGQAYMSNGPAAYPAFSSSLPGVTSVNGTQIPANGTLLSIPTLINGDVLSNDGTNLSWIPNGSASFPSCTAGQLYYAATSGITATCLSLGTGLSITSGTLNASGSGMTWPAAAGIAVYGGASAWTTSVSTLAGLDSVLGVTLASVSGTPTTGHLVLWQTGGTAPVLGDLNFTGSGNAVLATGPTLVTPNIGAATGTSLSVSGQLTSTVVTGTAPLVVASTTQVANLQSATAGALATTPTQCSGSGSLATGVAASGNANCHTIVNADLPASGVTAGSYTATNITVNAQGIVTAAANGTASASSITPGTTTVAGATAPCLIDNSTSTTMGCAALGNGLSISGGTLGSTFPNRTVTASPTIASTDMGGVVFSNVTGGGTVTVPAISSSVLASGMSVFVVNYSASTAAVSTTPTINAGGGCVTATGIPSGDAWQMVSNGTSIDCVQTTPTSSGGGSWPTTSMIVSSGETLGIAGTSTGATTFASAETGATSHVATFPSNTGTVAELNLAQIFTAGQTFNGANNFGGSITLSKNAVASSAPLHVTGSVFTGGTGTTTFPYFFHDVGATAVTTWNTNGTWFGANFVSGYTGNVFDIHVNGGASTAKLDAAGNLTVNSCTSCVTALSNLPTQAADTIVANATGSTASPTAVAVSSAMMAYLQASTPFTVTGTGCTPSAHVGDPWGGTVTLTSGCTAIVITPNGATGYTATNGFTCSAEDRTLQAAGTWFGKWGESSTTTTTVTLPIPSAAGSTDAISFHCQPY